MRSYFFFVALRRVAFFLVAFFLVAFFFVAFFFAFFFAMLLPPFLDALRHPKICRSVQSI